MMSDGLLIMFFAVAFIIVGIWLFNRLVPEKKEPIKIEPKPRQPNPAYICELCEGDTTPMYGDYGFWYNSLNGKRYCQCEGCHRRFREDESVMPESLWPFFSSHRQKDGSVRWCDTKSSPSTYAYWIAYRKIEKRNFEGEITDEEAKIMTNELTEHLVQRHTPKQLTPEECAIQEEKRKKDFWSNRKTFY